VLRLSGTIGGAPVAAELARGPDVVLPPELHWMVGAHYHPGEPTESRAERPPTTAR
jgi:hypothetical protein